MVLSLNEVKEALNANVLACEEHLDQQVASGCGADLMSDVLAFSKERAVLLTGLINPQVIRTAEMMDIKAICFVRGKTPTPEIIEFAKERSIVIMTTSLPMFSACGQLYAKGLGNCGDDE